MSCKKFLCILLSIVLIFSASLPALAAENTVFAAQGQGFVTAFSDVPAGHWAHGAIMNMVQRGMFSGTTAPVNGIGTFAPDKVMTKAEFIAVITRYLYPDAIRSFNSSYLQTRYWFEVNYKVGVQYGLFRQDELPFSQMLQPMTREEMAMILVRAAAAAGETLTEKISENRIPDFARVQAYYRDFVRLAYRAGFIAGTDAKGTFSPQGSLSRAQGAMVLYRLLAPETRVKVDAADPNYKDIHYSWEYKGSTWTYNLLLPIDAVEIYKSLERDPKNLDELYSSYVYDKSDDAYLHAVAESFREAARNQNWSDYEAIELAICFVQSLEYYYDIQPGEPGYKGDYPKYPLETLYDSGGDCEDTSILLASLLREMGYGCCLLLYDDHMAVGILGNDTMSGTYYEKDGRRYFYIETTGTGWKIGEIPDSYAGKGARLWCF